MVNCYFECYYSLTGLLWRLTLILDIPSTRRVTTSDRAFGVAATCIEQLAARRHYNVTAHLQRCYCLNVHQIMMSVFLA